MGTECLWEVFWELRDTQAAGFAGPERIGFKDILSWQMVREAKLPAGMVDLILAMDVAYLTEYYKDKK